MSGIIKGIGKAFRKVVRVVKKIALPALAIGAVVLTGGAALGVLPALGGAGGMLASLGLGPALTGVLSTAATGATIGAGGALLTGGNIVKGATRGFIGGAITGGIGAAMAPATSAATSAGTTAATGAGATVAPLSQAGQSVSALRQAAGIGAGGIGMPASLAAPTLSSALPSSMVSMAPASVGTVASSGGSGLSRVFGMMERNPMLTAGLVQGIGSGLTASAQARDARRQDEQTQASYDGVGDALYNYNGGGASGGQDPNSRFNAPVYGRVAYDRQSGRIVPVGG